MRVLELFGGYGSQALALENLGIEFKSDLCEIDKYAIQAYNQIHGETFNYGDICSIDETKLPYYDLITYSSPCQDFSQAGKQAGGEKGSGTRSSLLWECERIIRAVKPKYLLMENVKALTSKKFMPLFANWLRTLEDMGYKNWWKVLNAKDYGVPQNRERVFVVSILGGGNYQFPEPIPLTKRLKDVLEPQVDEKYYLSDEIVKRFIKSTENSKYPFGKEYKVLGSTSANFEEDTTKSRQWVMSAEGVSPTLDATQYKSPKQFLEPVACASRGRNPDNPSDRTTGIPTEQRIEINTNGTTNTITTVQKDNYVIEPLALDEQNQYIRKDGCVGTLTTDGSSPKHNNRVVEPQIDVVGHYMESKHEASRIVNSEGLYPTVKENHGTVPAVVEAKVMQEPINLYPNSGNPQAGRVYNTQGISPAMDTCQGGNRMPKIVDDIYPSREPRVYENTCPTLRTHHAGDLKVMDYRIRKLTPRECWRLMGVRDEQFEKLLEKKNFIMEGDNLCNVKFVDVAEKQKQSDTGTCVCFTIKDLLGTETPIPTRMQKEIEIGKNKNVKFAIEKLADVGHLGIATNIIKCSENGEMLYTLMEELDQHNMAIIELEKEVNENTERFLKITLEESFCQARLSTILILIALITRLKIYTYIKAKANIQSNIVITEDSSKNMTLKILSLEMEYIIQKISSSQLYKLAGNSIVVDVLMGIFKNMFEPTEQKGQLELL